MILLDGCSSWSSTGCDLVVSVIGTDASLEGGNVNTVSPLFSYKVHKDEVEGAFVFTVIVALVSPPSRFGLRVCAANWGKMGRHPAFNLVLYLTVYADVYAGIATFRVLNVTVNFTQNNEEVTRVGAFHRSRMADYSTRMVDSIS